MISTFMVRDETDLSRVKQLRQSRIKMMLSHFDPPRNQEIEERINRLLGECGCGMSTIFAFLSFGLMITTNALWWEHISRQYATVVGIDFALVISLSGIGKLLGLAMARRKLSTTIDGLITELNVSHCAVAVAAHPGGEHGMH